MMKTKAVLAVMMALMSEAVFSSCVSAKKLDMWKTKTIMRMMPMSMSVADGEKEARDKKEAREEREVRRMLKRQKRSMTKEAKKRLKELDEVRMFYRQRDEMNATGKKNSDANENAGKKKMTRKELRGKVKRTIERQQVYQIQGENH